MTEIKIVNPIEQLFANQKVKHKYNLVIMLGCGESWPLEGVGADSPVEAIQKVIFNFLFFVHMTYDWSVHPSKFQSIVVNDGLATFIPSPLDSWHNIDPAAIFGQY